MSFACDLHCPVLLFDIESKVTFDFRNEFQEFSDFHGAVNHGGLHAK